MSKLKQRPQKKDALQEEREELARQWGPLLTQTALVITIGVVVARVLMPETLRDPFEVSFGSESAPRGAGPVSSLVLDLISCLPAMLVMARCAVEKGYA